MVWDPVRKKHVALTPEEGVRQWFIGVLHEECGYPYHLMGCEVAFRFGEEIGAIAGTARKLYRADVVVYDREAKPFIVVECKRPEVELSKDVAMQAMRYVSVLEAPWIVLTNGTRTLAFRREGGTYIPAASLPTATPDG